MKKSDKKVSKIFNLIPDQLLEEFSILSLVDKSVTKLSGRIIFKLLIYGLLKHQRLSTRLFEKVFNSEQFEFFSQKDGHKTKHSSIADRIKTINPEYFEMIFEYTKEKAFQLEPAKSERNKLLRVDSTMLRIGAGLVEWGMGMGRPPKNGKGQKQLKLTVSLCNDFPQRVDIHHKKVYASEDKAMGEAILSAGQEDILLFDRGISKRSTYEQLCDQNTLFVTRAKKKASVEVIEPLNQVKDQTHRNLTFISDEKVYLFGEKNKKTRHAYRLIKAVNDEGKQIHFLTNIMDLPADQIVDLYARRWDIEVFFKFLKQELNLKHLVSHDLNGVKVMVYATLIAALLLFIYKKENQLKGYKIPKFQFALELEWEIINELANLKAQQILKEYGINKRIEPG